MSGSSGLGSGSGAAAGVAQVRIADPNARPPHVLGAAWAMGNKLVVFPSEPKGGNPRDEKKKSPSSPSLCHFVTWETSLYGPVMRKLVNESTGAFLALQKMADSGTPIDNGQLVSLSRQYRSIIRDCQEQSDQLAEEEEDASSRQTCIQQSELLYKLELIWNLIEVLMIEKSSIGIILPQLLGWIALHFPQADEQAREILTESPDSPETAESYWDTLILYLLQGRTEQALKLLRLHSEFQGEAFASLDELLRKMPLYHSQMSCVDFDFRWKHWQREVTSRLEEGDFATDDHLTQIASLLAGNESTFDALVPKCETWYQWMIGKLLFTNPDVKCYDLSYFAEQAIHKFGGLGKMTSLDSVLLAAIEDDVAQVMHELCTTLDNFWFPAHLLDLLHHADQLDNLGHHQSQDPAKQQQPSGKTVGPGMREFLLLDYATCLMSHQSLWQLGVLYLDHCPTQGRYRLELLLERIPLESERKANMILNIASERGMTDLIITTCKIMGMKALRENNRIGTAVAWALKSQDVTFSTYLADRVLSDYCNTGSFSSTDLLDHLGSSMILSDRLTFLAKYREFHKLCGQRDFRTAANLLHSLMWSRLAPKYFWVTLLIDTVPFVCCEDEVIFSSDQTYELMHCLQELSKDETLPKKQRLLLDEHEPQIRMQLARNLALALMNEGNEGT